MARLCLEAGLGYPKMQLSNHWNLMNIAIRFQEPATRPLTGEDYIRGIPGVSEAYTPPKASGDAQKR